MVEVLAKNVSGPNLGHFDPIKAQKKVYCHLLYIHSTCLTFSHEKRFLATSAVNAECIFFQPEFWSILAFLLSLIHSIFLIMHIVIAGVLAEIWAI